MLKQAFYTYILSLHPKNLKNAKQKPDFWLYCCMILNGFNKTDGYRLESFLFLVMILFPLLLMVWSNMNGRLPMPKAMFLSPMGLENRKQYIKVMIVVKIGVPVAVGFFLHILWGSIYGLSPICIFASLIAHSSFGLGMYVSNELRIKRNQLIHYAVRDENGIIRTAYLNWICMIVSFLMLVIFDTIGLVDNWKEGCGVVVGGLLVLLFFDFILIKERFYAIIEDICNYEVQFDISIESKKPTASNV